MMGIQLFKEKPKTFLALDIGNAAIKTLVFKKNKEGLTILGCAQEYFDKFGIFDSLDFKEDILKKTISRVIEEATKEVGQRPEGIFLGLPANILRLGLLFPKLLRKNPKEKISKREEKELKEEIFKKVKKEISQEFEKESGILAKELHFLSLKILEMKIDGYSLPTLERYNGKNLEFRVLATFLSKYSLDYYLKIVKNFGLPILNIGHYAQNLAIALDKRDALFFDIGSEVSQIFLARNGLLEKIDAFDLGGNFFSQLLSENLGLTERESRALKERYANKELSEESRVRIKEILAPGVQDWFSKLKLKLKEFGGLLPSEIFLFGGGSLLPDLKEILEKGDWEDLVFFSKVQPKLLWLRDLKNIDDKTEKASSVKNTISNGINNPQYIPTLLLCYQTF